MGQQPRLDYICSGWEYKYFLEVHISSSISHWEGGDQPPKTCSNAIICNDENLNYTVYVLNRGTLGGSEYCKTAKIFLKNPPHHNKKVGLKTQLSLTVEFDITAIPQCGFCPPKYVIIPHIKLSNTTHCRHFTTLSTFWSLLKKIIDHFVHQLWQSSSPYCYSNSIYD